MDNQKPFLQRVAEVDEAAKAKGRGRILPDEYSIGDDYHDNPTLYFKPGTPQCEIIPDVVAEAACETWLCHFCRRYDDDRYTAKNYIAWAEGIVGIGGVTNE